MAIDKLIPQYLNSDTDQKLVKAVEMTDNLNVRVSNDAEGTGGVIKNIKGTEVVSSNSSSDDFPSGDNRVIGSVSNEVNKEVLFLLYNSQQNHGIYRLDITTGKYKKLYEDSVLGFKRFGYAKCDVSMNENGDTLFYWTDNENPPMKVNVQRLMSGGYPSSLTSGTDSEKLISLTVAKQPPKFAPAYSVINNPAVKNNNIKSKNFQFAYKYVYQDGEHSALSPYSSLSISTSQLRDGLNTEEQKDFFNQINVTVVGSVGDVKEIHLYAREGNNAVFYKAKEIANPSQGGNTTIAFRNETLGSPIGENERKKTYDNVPQVARAQAIVGNRLMYGNYVEGYDNLDADIDMLPTYGHIPTVYNLTAEPYDSAPNGRGIRLDYSSIPATLSEDATVHINISYEQESVKISGDGLNGGNITSSNHNLDSFVIFTDDSDDRDKETTSREIKTIRDGIYGNLSGISVRAAVAVTAGMTRKQVRNEVRKQINAQFVSTYLSPLEGEDGFSVIGTGIFTTPFTQQSGRFEGEVVFQVNCLPSSSNTYLKQTILFDPIEANLRLTDFKDAGGKKLAEIVETKTIVLDLDGPGFGFYNGLEETTVTINNSGSFLARYLQEGRSFKSGSHHKLGVVYFDDRNRASGVQEAGSVYINPINDRSNNHDLHGRGYITMRLKHSAPSWAKSWAPVYVGRGETELKLFYSVKGAFLPKGLGDTSGYSIQDTIYVSLNNLFGKPDSYTKGSGADIEYKYEKGDKLRIVEYDGGQRTKVEFDVIDFVTLTDDPKTNPIMSGRSKDAIEATTGEFLIIRNNPNAPSFNTSSIAKDDTGWFKKCVIEIFRDDRTIENTAYYEIGKVYSANNGTHSDERDTTNVSVTLTSATNRNLFFTTTTRVFTGDVLVGTSGNKIRIRNVYRDGSNYNVHAEDLSTTALTTSQSYSFSVDNPDTVVEVHNGDVYMRPRLMFTKEKYIDDEDYDLANIISSTVSYVEDYSVSDFFSSKSSSIGRAFAHIPDARQIRRRASITYSDPYVMDGDRLNLSSFNLSLANWKDMNGLYGAIDALVNRSDSLTCIQDSKASQIPVNRNVVQYSDGGSNLTVSTSVLNQETYYAGDYGSSGNPESVVERFGVVYFADSKAGKVVRLSTDGVTLISDKGMNSFFEDKFKKLITNTDKIRAIGGFDPDNDEYLLTVEPLYNARLTVGDLTSDVPSDASGEFTINNITYTSQTVIWNAWGDNWNVFCGNWEDVGNGIVFTDAAFTPQSILVDASYLGSTSTINVIATTTNFTDTAIAQLNLLTGILTMPSQTCSGTNITLASPTTEEEGFTIAYKHKDGVWGSKYSFKPTNYVDINNDMYSFFDNTDNNVMWKHNANDTRNNFYGTQYTSIVEAVSNNNPSMVKVYQALAVEGGGNWSATLTTSDQSTTLSTSDFDRREGNNYAMVPRDTLKSTGHQIYLGKVATSGVNNDKVTFTTPVNRIPFVVGDILKTASGSTLTGTGAEISGIDGRKTIQCTAAVSGISDGDDIFVEHTSRIDGDPMRDVFMKVKLTSSDTSAFEVHALSLIFDRSRLHNDRVN